MKLRRWKFLAVCATATVLLAGFAGSAEARTDLVKGSTAVAPYKTEVVPWKPEPVTVSVAPGTFTVGEKLVMIGPGGSLAVLTAVLVPLFKAASTPRTW